MPVTKPVLSTVAMPVDAETHGFEPAGVPEPVNWVVPVPQMLNVPVTVGKALLKDIDQDVQMILWGWHSCQ